MRSAEPLAAVELKIVRAREHMSAVAPENVATFGRYSVSLIARASLALSSFFVVAFNGRCSLRNSAADLG
jgi:hypothetical protein